MEKYVSFKIQTNKVLNCNDFEGVYIDPSYHKDVFVHPNKRLIKPLKGIRVLKDGILYTIIGCKRNLPDGETIESLGGLEECKFKWEYYINCVVSRADITQLKKI